MPNIICRYQKMIEEPKIYVYIKLPVEAVDEIEYRNLKIELNNKHYWIELFKTLAEETNQNNFKLSHFFRELIKGSGSTQEQGPFIFILNNRIVKFSDLHKILVKNKDKIILVPPITGG